MKRLPLILCIDRDSDACQILEILMQNAGFEVISRSSGLDALRLAQSTCFSAIVTEYLLADIDALQLVQEIKKINPEVPIVFYSAESRFEHKTKCLSAGAKAFLVKPNDLELIEQTILDLALK